MQYHKYSLTEVEEMIPFEREICFHADTVSRRRKKENRE
jgi:hypothetical protein